MKALVLGGNGFIGSHVVEELVMNGHGVRVFDRVSGPGVNLSTGVDYRQGDLSDLAALAEALQGVEVVYHLASTTVPSTSNLDPVGDVSGNLIPTVRLLEQMVRLGVPRIIFMSSGGTVYGNPQTNPVQVDQPVAPICSYGVVKVAIENYLHMFRNLYGLSPVVLRASNPYGPRQGHLNVQGVVATFLRRVLDNEPIRVWGDGATIRDYIYVDDLARLCVLAGTSAVEGIFNAGSGVGTSILDLLDVVAEVTGTNAHVKFENPRDFDVRRIVLDIQTTSVAFGWRPEVVLLDGVQRHWDWMRTVQR